MIRGKKVPVKNYDIKMSLHNRFDIEVIDAKTGKVKRRAFAENVVCDKLWTQLFTPATYFNYIHYGTGTGTPSTTDTSLFTFLGYKAVTSAVYDQDYINGWMSLRKQIQLDETTANGSTLSEVGIASGTGSTTLCTHAMLKDMNGNQISIAKTATDIINIYATVFLHYDTAGYSTGRCKVLCIKEAFFYKWLLGDYSSTYFLKKAMYSIGYGKVTGTSGNDHSVCQNTETLSWATNVGTKSITCTMSRLAAASANLGGLMSISICDATSTQPMPVISCKLDGTTITGEAIGTGDGVTTDFEFDFPMVSDATIYIDGNEVTSGVTVNENCPKYVGGMGAYFEVISANSPYYMSLIDNNNINDSSTSAVFYNPFYALGIDSYNVSACTVEVSNDLSTWVTLSSTDGTKSVDAGYKAYKYWRVTRTGATGYVRYLTTSGCTSNHLHISPAPAVGAVITGDYTTAVAAKDSNHVYDFSMTITLGEKTV